MSARAAVSSIPSLPVFDQGGPTQLLQVALRELLEFLLEDRVAGLPPAGRIVRLGLGLVAHRKHLDAELGDLGGRQLADLSAIEYLALFHRQIGGAAHDL